MERILMTVFMLVFALGGNAQVEMADHLRSSGKIFTVVAVLSVIFIGIIIILIWLERRLSRLEKNAERK